MGIERNASIFSYSFSDSVSVTGPGRYIHVAGQIGLGADGQLVPGGMYEQTVATIGHVERALGRWGADLTHVLRITSYLTTLEHYEEFDRARRERFSGALPASAAVQVAGLMMEAVVEMDAVAFLPGHA